MMEGMAAQGAGAGAGAGAGGMGGSGAGAAGAASKAKAMPQTPAALAARLQEEAKVPASADCFRALLRAAEVQCVVEDMREDEEQSERDKNGGQLKPRLVLPEGKSAAAKAKLVKVWRC
jgi:hypothetical protein